MTARVTVAIVAYGAAETLGAALPMSHNGALTIVGITAGALYLVSYLVLAGGLTRWLTTARSRS